MVSIKIKVNAPITVEKKNDKLDICCENTTITVYNDHKIRELIYQVYKVHEEETDETEPNCFIEIIPSGANSYVFSYPYKRRHDALKSYNLLLHELEPFMKDTVNQIE